MRESVIHRLYLFLEQDFLNYKCVEYVIRILVHTIRSHMWVVVEVNTFVTSKIDGGKRSALVSGTQPTLRH